MTGRTIRRQGAIRQGHRVASGLSGDARFPEGTIAPQLRFFRRDIDDFDLFLGGPPFPGTINLAFAGARVVPGIPDHAIGPVRWTDALPPERFLLSRCAIEQAGARYPAWLYIPDPATKPAHHQPADTVELLLRAVPGLSYGDGIWLIYDAATLSITGA